MSKLSMRDMNPSCVGRQEKQQSKIYETDRLIGTKQSATEHLHNIDRHERHIIITSRTRTLNHRGRGARHIWNNWTGDGCPGVIPVFNLKNGETKLRSKIKGPYGRGEIPPSAVSTVGQHVHSVNQHAPDEDYEKGDDVGLEETFESRLSIALDNDYRLRRRIVCWWNSLAAGPSVWRRRGAWL